MSARDVPFLPLPTGPSARGVSYLLEKSTVLADSVPPEPTADGGARALAGANAHDTARGSVLKTPSGSTTVAGRRKRKNSINAASGMQYSIPHSAPCSSFCRPCYPHSGPAEATFFIQATFFFVSVSFRPQLLPEAACCSNTPASITVSKDLPWRNVSRARWSR